MTTDLLDFPAIEAPPVAAPPARALVAPPAASAAIAVVAPSIKDTVLAQFKDTEAGIIALAEKYRAVAFDVTTTKGMAAAIAARADLRDNGKLALTRAETRVKKDVNDLKRVMSDEVDRLVAIVQPVHDAIDAQIKVEVQRKADEKAERDRIEALRVAGHQERLAKIGGYLTHCQQHGMTAARIQTGIDKLAAATFGPDWQEFAVPAADLQCRTLEAMRTLHGEVAAREAEALRQEQERQAEADRLAAQRVEQERVAAQQAETQRQLDAAAELLRAQQAATARQAAEVEAARVAMLPPSTEVGPRAVMRTDFPFPMSNPPFGKTAQPGVQTPAAQGEVAGNLAQPQPDATFPSGDAAAASVAGDEAAATAVGSPAPSVTLTTQQLLAEACDLLDSWVSTPPTKKRAAECFAQVSRLRTLGNVPRYTNTPT